MGVKNRGHWRTRIACAAAAAALLSVPVADLIQGDRALAQLKVLPARGLAVNARADRRDNQDSGVYVKDSAIAADKFELGKRMERLKEWHKAADVYQEILEKYQDRVVAIEFDENERPVKYVSVTVAVQERLSRWPLEGLNVYRGRFEAPATVLLESARGQDLGLMHRVMSQYFATDAAKKAGMRLMQLYLENGEFSAAAWIGDQLLTLHPALTLERPGVLFQTAVAYHLAGGEPQARQLYDELSRKHGEVLGTVAGVDMPLSQALEKVLKQEPPRAMNLSADSWPTPNGNLARNLVTAVEPAPGARIYKVELPDPPVPAAMKQILEAQQANAHQMGMSINVLPAVDRRELFFQDGYHVFAVHLESGVPLSGWQQTHSQRQGRYQLAGASPVVQNLNAQTAVIAAQTPRQYSVTVTDNAVLAIMGQEPISIGFGAAPAGNPGTRLVCLDRATGRERWSPLSPADLPMNPGNARNLNFSGSPLVVGDNVYVIARGTGGAGTEDCNVVCIDLNTRAHKWTSYVASAQLTMPNNVGSMPNMPGGDTLSHLAFASGRVFVATNLGAVAALDAYTGATAWLSIYPRDDSAVGSRQRMAMARMGWGAATLPDQNAIRPWEFNAPILHDGKVFVMPADSRQLQIYDAGSGGLLKEIDRTIDYSQVVEAQPVRLTMLLAVMDDKLVLGCSTSFGGGIIILDWPKCRPIQLDSRRLTPDSIYNMVTFGDEIRGRPFVSTDRMYVPTRDALRVYDMKRRRLLSRFPHNDAPWAEDEGSGNVLATADHVIIANGQNISVYTDLDVTRRKYQDAINADPGNIEPRLIFAELLFSAGQYREAGDTLDQAIRVMGGMQAMRDGPGRDRLFGDALMFAQRIAANKRAAEVPLADAFFDRAAAAALTAPQQVSYRVARARYLEARPSANKLADATVATRLCQEILQNPQMRMVNVANDGGSTSPAWQAAEKWIATLISRFGPAVYADFEKQASEMLAQLQAERKPDELMAIADRFPNAEAAPRALMAAAQSYEATRQPRLAIRVLRQMWSKYKSRLRSGPEEAQLIESIARNHLRRGNAEAALGRLQWVGAGMNDLKLAVPFYLPDGRELATADGRKAATIGEAVAALQAMQDSLLTEHVPDSRLPAPRKKPAPLALKDVRAIPNVQALLRPAEPRRTDRFDRIIGWSNNQIVCYPAGKTEPMWSSQALQRQASGLLWLQKQLLVWNGEQVAVIDADKGDTAWRLNLWELPPAVDATAEAFTGPVVAQQANAPAQEQLLHLTANLDQVIGATSAGRVFVVDAAGGKLVWQTRLPAGQGIAQLLANDEFTVARIVDGSRVHVAAFDNIDGLEVFRRTWEAKGTDYPLNCVLSGEGILVWTGPRWIAAKDLYGDNSQASWANTSRSFAGLTRADHLALFGRKVLAVSDGGQFIERRALALGNSQNLLNTGAGRQDIDTTMRIVGQRLYVASRNSYLAYHLTEETSPATSFAQNVVAQPRSLMLTSEYAILPGNPNGDDKTWTLQFFYRRLLPANDTRKATESGARSYEQTFAEPAKITAWQAVDGGVYYLTGEGKLCFLPGTADGV